MGNPLQTIPNLPPAISLSGAEQLWVNQAGVDRRTTTGHVAALLAGIGAGGAGGLTAETYADLRASAFPVVPGAFTPVITLTDPYKAGVFVPAPPVPPGQAFNHRDNGGTVIVDSLGQAWQRVYDERINAAWFYNEPSGTHYFGDNSGVKITAADIAANPQWIGMPDGSGQYPVGTYWDYVCLQEWLYACAACRSTPLNILWNITYGSYQLNQPGYCPAGLYKINQQLMLNATGANIEFASRRGGVITWYGNHTGTDPTTPGFLMNSLAYSQIRNLTIQDGIGCQNTCLVSIDHQTGYPGFVGGLSPQLNTFENWFVGGNYGNPTWGGVGVALAGGAAQGDTQCFINIFVGQCQNGVVIGGDNAIGILFLGGNMTNCTRGVANIGAGSFTSINLLTEGDTYNYYGYPHADQLTMDGADFVSSEVSTESSLVIGNRSESMVFAIDTNYLLEVQTSAIAFAGVASWQANAHYHRGYGIGVAGNGFTVAVLADDGGPPWFMGTLDTTATVISVPVLANGQPPNWTPNQWAGYGIWLRYGSNGYCQSNAVVSNTANTLTLYNPYPKLSYPLAFRLFQSGGPTQPNWGAVATTAYGRTTRNASGYEYTTTVGSNFVQGIPPPVGAWVMVCGADLFNLQAVTGSPAMPGPLFGKVATATPAASFQGYVTGTTLTVVSITGGGVIAIGTSVTGGGNIVKQLTGPAGGVGTYQLDTPGMYPTAAQFWAHISTPGVLVVEQMYSGQIAVGQTIATNGLATTPTITGALSQAAFTAQIDNGSGAPGNVLTVSAVSTGALAAGQTIVGPGIPTGASAPTITQQLPGGTPGGPGTYAISGGVLQIASEAMTSVTTGVGSYTISDTTSTMTRIWTESGVAGTQVAMATIQGFTLVDNAGNPVNAGVAINQGMGYWGQPIVDGGLVWMPVDFDVLFGVKRARGVQMIAYGKANHVGELEFDGALPQNLLSAAYLRDQAIGVQPVNYRPSPDIGLAVPWQPMNTNPFTMTVGVGGIGSTRALYFYVTTSLTLNLPALQPNLAMDFELVLESWAATPPVITWGANVRAAAPTLTLGAQNQITVVRLKWWGSINNSAGGPTSSWFVTSIQGPL